MIDLKINIRKLIVSILIPLLLSGLVSILVGGFTNYRDIIRPFFAPPGIVFPIVWTILYTLMGISYYIVDESTSLNKKEAKNIYIIQLIVNLLWSFIFFKFNWYLLAFIWILLLIFTIFISYFI